MWRFIGAGDIKLFAAYSMAIDPDYLVFSIVLVLFLGGLLSVVYMVMHYLRKGKGEIGIPYGVAISLGFILPIVAYSY